MDNLFYLKREPPQAREDNGHRRRKGGESPDKADKADKGGEQDLVKH